MTAWTATERGSPKEACRRDTFSGKWWHRSERIQTYSANAPSIMYPAETRLAHINGLPARQLLQSPHVCAGLEATIRSPGLKFLTSDSVSIAVPQNSCP